LSTNFKKQKTLTILFKKMAKQQIARLLGNKSKRHYDLKFRNNGYFESVEYFHQRYQLEQRRAERKGYEFVLIVIDLRGDGKKFGGNIDTRLLNQAEKLLISTSRTMLRTTDVIVKFDPFRLMILLPDTDLRGGQSVKQRIVDMAKELSNPELLSIIGSMKIDVYGYPSQQAEIDELLNGSSRHQTVESQSGEAVTSDSQLDGSLVLKRCLDIVGSLAALILFSPLILVISILIKLTSPGPILFKQERVGYKGKKFIIYKFRTMYHNEDAQIHKNFITDFIINGVPSNQEARDTDGVYKLKDDPRVTPLGRLLRRTSLDEIVQFVNVLKGDMSLVGPRPPIPYEVELYDLWHRRRFLTVKPGITGLWQIYARNITSFNDMVRLDLIYANNRSLVLDLKILMKTFGAVLSMKGAY